MTDSTVRTSELEYTVTALINRKCIKSMFYMTVVIYDVAIMICMISEINDFSCILYDYEYDIMIMYGTCMLV